MHGHMNVKNVNKPLVRKYEQKKPVWGHAAGYMRRTSMVRYKDVNRLEDCMPVAQGKVQRQAFETIVKNSMKFARCVCQLLNKESAPRLNAGHLRHFNLSSL